MFPTARFLDLDAPLSGPPVAVESFGRAPADDGGPALVALTVDGNIRAVRAGFDPVAGTRRTVAENLPIGLEASPGLLPSNVPTGVAVGADGAVYMSADRNNAIYRFRPMR